jgi:branched-chain amino acid transport system substrate-binding protein
MDRRDVLKLLGVAAAAGVTGAVSGCAAEAVGTPMEQPNGRSLVIGLVAPAVGAFGKVGDDIAKGFRLYLADHDNLIARYRADLRVVEEGNTTAAAVSAARSLVTAGAMVVAGVAAPTSLNAVVPTFSDAGIPVISTNAAPGGLNNDWVWRAAAVEGESGASLGGFAHRIGDRAFILRDTTSTAQAEANGFTRAYNAVGGQIAGALTGTDSLAAQLSSALSSGAKTVFAAHTGDAALALLTAYRQADTEVPLIGPGTLTESTDLTKLRSLPIRVYTSMYYAPDLDNDENRRFVASYQNTHGVQPSSVAMASYDAGALLDRALRLVVGDLTATKLRDSFKQLGQIRSPRGPWAFNSSQGPQQTWYLRRLRLDGQVPSNLLDSDLVVLS